MTDTKASTPDLEEIYKGGRGRGRSYNKQDIEAAKERKDPCYKVG